MEFTQVIQNRYSCKKFDGQPVSRAQLDAVLQAGRLAPTAKNLQEQRVYVLESAAALAKVDAATPCRYGAPTVLAVAYDAGTVYTYPGGGHDSGAEDAAIVATHMLLAAQDAGLASCWLNNFDPEALAAALGLPENEKLLMLLDLGHAAPGAGPLPNHASRKPLDETVRYL